MQRRSESRWKLLHISYFTGNRQLVKVKDLWRVKFVSLDNFKSLEAADQVIVLTAGSRASYIWVNIDTKLWLYVWRLYLLAPWCPHYFSLSVNVPRNFMGRLRSPMKNEPIQNVVCGYLRDSSMVVLIDLQVIALHNFVDFFSMTV